MSGLALLGLLVLALGGCDSTDPSLNLPEVDDFDSRAHSDSTNSNIVEPPVTGDPPGLPGASGRPDAGLSVSALSGSLGGSGFGSKGLAADRILPVDEAFRFESYYADTGLVLMWQIQPGHYLYRDKFQVLLDGEPADLSLPPGEWRNDEIFGEVQVFEALVQIEISMNPAEISEISVRYQGCAVQGYCYPPQNVSLTSGKTGLNSGKL